jgi:hypothetical protein
MGGGDKNAFRGLFGAGIPLGVTNLRTRRRAPTLALEGESAVPVSASKVPLRLRSVSRGPRSLSRVAARARGDDETALEEWSDRTVSGHEFYIGSEPTSRPHYAGEARFAYEAVSTTSRGVTSRPVV